MRLSPCSPSRCQSSGSTRSPSTLDPLRPCPYRSEPPRPSRPVVELLLTVSFPVTAPVAVGLNCTCSANVWFKFSVAGKVPPTIVKPVPR